MSESAPVSSAPSASSAPSSPSSSSAPSVSQGTSTQNSALGQSNGQSNGQGQSQVPGVSEGDNHNYQVNPEGPQGETSTETPSERMFKVLVDGVESEVPESQMVREYQKAKASQARFEEANKLRGQAERFVEQLRTDPMSILMHPSLGIDFPALAEKFMYEKVQNELMTPEERQASMERAELERYRANEGERLAREREARSNQLRDHYAAEYEKKFQASLETAGLPRTAWTVSRMATYVSQALQAGHQPDFNEVASLVREDFVNEQKSLFGALDGGKLVEMLGDDVTKKIRAAEVAKLKGTPKAQEPVSASAPKAIAKGLSRDDWREELARRAGLR